MAVEVAQAYVSLIPKFDNLSGTIGRELGDIGTQGGAAAGKNFQSGFKGMLSASFLGNVLADLAGAATRAITGSIRAGFDDLKQVQVLQAQTEAAIRATGGAANVSAEQIANLAGALQDVTATEDDAIVSGANMLLTFKNIKNEVGAGNNVFDQATAALVDMSRAMGQEPRDAAIQLGKALNDPIAGVGALTRVGVQFTEDQKDLIETLVESGDVMGAQKVILEELNGQFGGSGSAYAQTYAGKLDTINNKFGDLREKVLTAALPALMSFADLGIVAISSIANSPLIDALGTKLGEIGTSAQEKLTPIFDIINRLGDSEQGFTFGAFFDELANISPLVAGLVPIVEALAPHMPVLAAAVADLAPAAADLLVALVPLVPPLTDLALQVIPPLVDGIVKIAPGLEGAAEGLGVFVDMLGGGVAGQLGTMSDGIDALANDDLPAFHRVLRDAGPFGAVLQNLTNVGVMIGAQQIILRNFANYLGQAQGKIFAVLGQLPNAVRTAVSGAGNWLVESGRAIVDGLVRGLVSKLQAVRNAASNIMSTVRNFFPRSPAKEGPFSGAGWTAVRKSGEALMAQFTSGFGVDVAPAMMSSLGGIRAGSAAYAGGAGGGITWNGNIVTTRPASEAFVTELQQQSFLLGLG